MSDDPNTEFLTLLTTHDLGYRRQSKRLHIPLSEQMLEHVGHEVAKLSDHGQARREALESCLHTLPAEHRQIVLMRYFEDLEVDQIAERVNSTAGAVYRALSRLRYTLLECVEKRLQNEEVAS